MPNHRNVYISLATSMSKTGKFQLTHLVKELHQFVCLVSCFRGFVLNFSLIAKPLYDLIEKNTPFIFGPKEIETFE